MLNCSVLHKLHSFTSTLILFLFLVHGISMAKGKNPQSDSLETYTFDQLYDKIRKEKHDKILQDVYLKFFLIKAKSEKDEEEIFNGYRNFVNYSADENLVLVYADSMVLFTQKAKNSKLIGSALLSRGIAKYGQKKYIEALEDYVKANEIITDSDDQYLKYKLKYNIAHVKYYLENYTEAISLFKECVGFFKVENPRAYLNSLHSLSLCYNRMGDIGKSSDLNQLGILEGERLSDHSMFAYFNYLEGINHYFKNNYNLAIKQILESLDKIKDNDDFANQAVAHFYLGKSYKQLENDSKAIKHFLLVDEIFNRHKYIRPDLRETHEILIAYAQSQNDLEAERYFTQQLIKTDSILIANQKKLPSKIHSQYDTQELNQSKLKVENEKNRQIKINRIFLFSILVFIILAMGLGYRYFKNKAKYELKFKELMAEKKLKDLQSTEPKLKTENINSEAEASLLKHLEKFEKNKTFLEKDLNQAKLAAYFKSNNKYISAIIQTHRHKGFNEYINDLRIDYIISLLQTDRMIRKYNNAALAELAGFSSTERFTKAFKSRIDMPPTFFINKLISEIDN